MSMMVVLPHNQKQQLARSYNYQLIRQILYQLIQEHGEISFPDMATQIERHIGDYDGALMWYAVKLKLEFEARGIARNAHPAMIRIVK